MSLGYWETLASISGDGTAVTGVTARTSMLLGPGGAGRYTLAANRLRVGDVMHLKASGRVSSVITTPGTYRWDLSMGAVGTAIFDTLALTPQTAAAQTNVAWLLEAEGIVRTIGDGTLATMFWQGRIDSAALLTSGLNAATILGPGSALVPNVAAPVVGAGFNSAIANIVDLVFTPSLTTISCTLHEYALSLKTSSGF
jgi:hypothetical protein